MHKLWGFVSEAVMICATWDDITRLSLKPEISSSSRLFRCLYTAMSQYHLIPQLALYNPSSNPRISSGLCELLKNQHGDMVRILCEEDFVAALSGYHSWEMCLLIEGYNYKPAPTVSRYQATPAQRVQPGVGVSAQRHQAGRRAVHQRAFQFGRRFGEEVAQANQEHIHNMFNVATGMMFGCKPCGTALGTWCDCHGE